MVRAIRLGLGPRMFQSIRAPMGLSSKPLGFSNRMAGDGFCLATRYVMALISSSRSTGLSI